MEASPRSLFPPTPPSLRATPSFLPPLPTPPGTVAGGRLDRILDLVTAHEADYRQQELRVADLAKRVADCEALTGQLGAAGSGSFWDELSSLRSAVEQAQRQARAEWEWLSSSALTRPLQARSAETTAHGGAARQEALSAAQARLEEQAAAQASTQRRSVRGALSEVVERVAQQLEQQATASHAEQQATRQQVEQLSARVAQLAQSVAVRDEHILQLRAAHASLAAQLEERAQDTSLLADRVGAALHAQRSAGGAYPGIGAYGYGAYAPRLGSPPPRTGDTEMVALEALSARLHRQAQASSAVPASDLRHSSPGLRAGAESMGFARKAGARDYVR